MALIANNKPVSTRGFVKEGVVVSDKGKLTVIIAQDLVQYIPKYKRYARSKSRIPAHNPPEINAKMGDLVRIAQCRKISKTKAWIVTAVLTRGATIVREKHEELEACEKMQQERRARAAGRAAKAAATQHAE